uniref:C-type lectin domain-containing protein n=1 Tax=Chrysemys picta bellii TaxID=8478 RepID=A0A8C3HAI5_CHRPI
LAIGTESTLIKFEDDTKLGGITTALEDRVIIQNDLDKLEKWSELNRMKFNLGCYYFSNDIMTWDDSERNCTGMDSHLVVINTGAEQDFIFTRVNGTVTGSEGMNYCIGLIDKEKKGQWHWVDETPYNDTAASRINTQCNGCVCVCVGGERESEKERENWNDIACFKLYNRICETAALIF